VEDHSWDIILGARSAVFLPFTKLGLIIVDEEHDSSFKQSDAAPRYNAKDAAVYLGMLTGARVLLGSATPSYESYSNAMNGKYHLVKLMQRYGGFEPPETYIVNLRELAARKQLKGQFSSFLLEQISKAKKEGEQAILFQNRRGFSLRLECSVCGWNPECPNCDVQLIYHKKAGHLKCHYCGHIRKMPRECPECSSTRLQMQGFGTERIEEELSVMMPDIKVVRLDMDSAGSKGKFQRIIHGFESREYDVLVGTQMVTKGLDFENVGVVGIINADNIMYYPDFRSYERAYQLLAQDSGRSGRKRKRGKVIIQTYHPAHEIIRSVTEGNFTAVFDRLITERKRFRYPPFYRLITITLKHQEAMFLVKASRELGLLLKGQFGNSVLGPEFPPVSRIRQKYLNTIMVKLPKSDQLLKKKSLLTRIISDFQSMGNYRSVEIVVDVDPQ